MEPLRPKEVITKINVDEEIKMINDVLSKTNWGEGVLTKTITINKVLGNGKASKIKDIFIIAGWRDMSFSYHNGTTLVSLWVSS